MEYLGELKGFPDEVVEKMIERQEEAGNEPSVSVFEDNSTAGRLGGGFDWSDTVENHSFWSSVINTKNFQMFFSKYPKAPISVPKERFKEGDLVVVTEFKGKTEWINHWFSPGEVMKLGGKWWKGRVGSHFAAFCKEYPDGGGMGISNYKLRYATQAEIAASAWPEEAPWQVQSRKEDIQGTFIPGSGAPITLETLSPVLSSAPAMHAGRSINVKPKAVMIGLREDAHHARSIIGY